MESRDRTLPARGYYVQSEDPTALLALDVRIGAHTIEWYDTLHQRGMNIAEVLEDDGNVFAFRRAAAEGGWTYRFLPLTLELYSARVRTHLWKQLAFADETSMFDALEESRRNAL